MPARDGRASRHLCTVAVSPEAQAEAAGEQAMARLREGYRVLFGCPEPQTGVVLRRLGEDGIDAADPRRRGAPTALAPEEGAALYALPVDRFRRELLEQTDDAVEAGFAGLALVGVLDPARADVGLLVGCDR